MSEKLFAVVGKMHSGKTTFAQALVELGYTRMAFADPVKDIGAAMLNTFAHGVAKFQLGATRMICTPYYDRESINEMKGHPAIRGLLQLVGTELGRDWRGPDSLWIDIFQRRLENDREGWLASGVYGIEDYCVVNDDCRFPNEAERLRKLGFQIVKLERNERERIVSIKNALRQTMTSEEEIEAAFQKMLSHPSESNVDLIEPDIVLQSISVEQLQTAAGHLDRMPYGFQYTGEHGFELIALPKGGTRNERQTAGAT